MIKLKDILIEIVHAKYPEDIIVGAISVNSEKIIASDKYESHNKLMIDNPQVNRNEWEFWRYSKRLKTLFFWHPHVETEYKTRVEKYLIDRNYSIEKIITINSLPDNGLESSYEKQKSLYNMHGDRDDWYKNPDDPKYKFQKMQSS
jgi:hypothetical protein